MREPKSKQAPAGAASKKSPAKRPPIPERERILVWAAAAGRCTFCNSLLTENEDLGLAVPIGQLAHNVGWSKSSPRGEDSLDLASRQDAANLLLLCGSCHKPV